MFYQIDTFTDKPFVGNPTAIILEEPNNEYTDNQKALLAREINLSVCVFVSESEKADFKFTFFTPRKQIDLSGHGIIGATWLLASLEKIRSKKSKVKIETAAGIFSTELLWTNDTLEKVYLLPKKPTFREVEINKQKLADILGIRVEKIESNDKLPMIIADAGNPKLLILISSKEMTDALVPKYDEVERLCRKHKVSGLHLYTFDTYLDGSTCYTRQFEIIQGLPETSASATANAALGAYLVKKGFAQPGVLMIEQGESLNRACKIEVRVEATPEKIQNVKVGGKAKLVFKFQFVDKNLFS